MRRARPFDGEIHAYADAFPMLPDEDLDALAADIAANGQRHPILLSRDGVLLDGRNRLAACQRAGVEPVFDVFDGDPVALIVSENMQRRDLTKAQKAHLAVAGLSESVRTCGSTELATIAGVSRVAIAEATHRRQVPAGSQRPGDRRGHQPRRRLRESPRREDHRQQRELRRTELTDNAPDLAALISDEFTIDMAYAAYEERHRKEREAAAAEAATKRLRNTDWHAALATIEAHHHPEALAYLKAAYQPRSTTTPRTSCTV